MCAKLFNSALCGSYLEDFVFARLTRSVKIVRLMRCLESFQQMLYVQVKFYGSSYSQTLKRDLAPPTDVT